MRGGQLKTVLLRQEIESVLETFALFYKTIDTMAYTKNDPAPSLPSAAARAAAAPNSRTQPALANLL